MLELKNICFERDNKKILKNINLKLENDKFYVITGPNGSGKSTLAKIIMGINKQDSGQVILDGKDISNLPINERANIGIGFAFQQPVKFKGITEYVDREINSSLSGGELKRIEIATVAVRNSKLTIFDEPEAGIDLWSFNNLIKIFEDMREKTKGTTLIISHQERILDIADKVILLNNGEIEKIGESKELMKNIIPKTNCCKLGGDA